MRKPISVARCNDDMEGLVSDSNRSIATLAITTLLKTGNENSIDRLMKQISSFMSEIGDEFKIVVVKAIRELCIKYPQKVVCLSSFHMIVLLFVRISLLCRSLDAECLCRFLWFHLIIRLLLFSTA